MSGEEIFGAFVAIFIILICGMFIIFGYSIGRVSMHSTIEQGEAELPRNESCVMMAIRKSDVKWKL